MADWKNTFNLKDFIKNSDENLAKIFLEEFNILIDGYTPFSRCSVKYFVDGYINIIGEIISHCEIIQFKNYSDLKEKLEKLGKNNYIFLHYIRPFELKMTTISDEYNIIGCERRVRLREQKINQLLND